MRRPKGVRDARGGGIVIANVFSDYNRGGAALTAACIEAVKSAFPDQRISLVAVPFPGRPTSESHAETIAAFPDVDVLSAPFPVPPGRTRSLITLLASLLTAVTGRPAKRSDSLERVADAELVVSRGGYIFVERHGWGGLVALWNTVYPLVYGSRVGVPTVVFSSSIGPFRTRTSKVLNAWILRRAALVLARDPSSYRRALDLGVARDRLREVPDSVFATDPPDPEARDRAVRRLGLKDHSFAVVTVRRLRSLPGRPDLIERLAETIAAALEEQIVERIVVVDHVTGGDAAVSRDLVERVGDQRVEFVDEHLSAAELMALYSAARFVLGCRLHSAVFAVVAGTPAVAISLAEAKAEGVLAEVGLERFVVADDFRSTELLALLRAIAADGGAPVRAEVRVAAEEARRRAQTLPGVLQAVAHANRRVTS